MNSELTSFLSRSEECLGYPKCRSGDWLGPAVTRNGKLKRSGNYGFSFRKQDL